MRPQAPPPQAAWESGKTKDHTVHTVWLVHALLRLLLLRATWGGRVHEKPLADATPSRLPAGSRLVQALGFLALTLPPGAILRPTKTSRGQELTLAQARANQALAQRRLRSAHGHRRGKRCRSVTDRIRLWKEGVRDGVMDLCGALPNFRVRITPWQPMV